MFFKAIQDKDFKSFGPLLIRFCVLAGLFIVAAVFRRYLTLMVQICHRIARRSGVGAFHARRTRCKGVAFDPVAPAGQHPASA